MANRRADAGSVEVPTHEVFDTASQALTQHAAAHTCQSAQLTSFSSCAQAIVPVQGGRVVSRRADAGSAEVPTHEVFDTASHAWTSQPSMLQHRTALAAASLQVCLQLAELGTPGLHLHCMLWTSRFLAACIVWQCVLSAAAGA